MTHNRFEHKQSQLYWVADNVISTDFPPVESALRSPDGLLAIGGDLNQHRLLSAYQQGIFPWYNQGQPIMWWSPDPRCVFIPDNIRIRRSLKKTLNKKIFKVTLNQAFAQVVAGCAEPREEHPETWISQDIVQAYTKLHETGHAHSVECWHDDQLVGGLYGIAIGKVFFGESMFSRKSDASKVALVHLSHFLLQQQFELIDCQIYSAHLETLGAITIPRQQFSTILQRECRFLFPYDWPAQELSYDQT